MPSEWEPQDAVILAWPHENTDWACMLPEVEHCFVQVARNILRTTRLIVVSPCEQHVRAMVDPQGDFQDKIVHVQCDTNDTWARDFGPIALKRDGAPHSLLDFKFNAWGMKFAACLDNLICREMDRAGILRVPLVSCQDFVLEGGSIESDGCGTILTTEQCLLSVNRNDNLSKEEIEHELKQRLGARKVLWLKHGALVGDDTDSHIDTLARLAPGNVILYVKCDNAADEQYPELQLMEAELRAMTDARGRPFELVPLPCPDAIVDEDGNRLPATYANFLITNGQVLVPTYGQEEKDLAALEAIGQVFKGYNVVGIDCNALIKQHGSLHCITMQIPENFIAKS